MRNLKRALSLALASAMLLGMMVIGASAADYKDDSSITNTEAVEVLTAIGVVGGDTTGNYNPTATLTRAEFCVMIANMLSGGKFDATLFTGATTPFTDVTGHWGASYIAYCYSVGVIAGTSATTFSPDNTLTAAQASAILLSALGYNQNGEFGANGQFELNVTRWAQSAGLYKDLSVSAVAGISRDNTAQLIFNALTNTTPVGYSTLAEAYYTLGTNVLSGVVEYGDDLNAITPNAAYQRTLGYKNFTLTQTNANVTDAFGRPSAQWQHPVNNVATVIGTYSITPGVTYTKAVSEADLYTALGLTGTTKTITVYTDGTANADYSLDKADDSTKLGGNGALLEGFVKDNGDVVVTIVNTYIGEVVSVTAATSTAARKVTIAGNNYAAGAFETDNFAREDVVLYTYSNMVGETGVKSATLATKVTGQLTGYTTGKSLTVAGSTYSYAAKADDTADGATLKNDVDVYLDSYGYAINVTGATADTKYAYVLKYTANGGTYGSDMVAQLLLSDGTVADASIKTNTGSCGADNLVSYTVDSDGKYTITKVMDAATVTAATITKGSSTVSVTGSTGVSANGNTVFLVVTGTSTSPVYTAYTGIANVPSITISSSTPNGYAYALKDGTAELVYVDARSATVTTDATNVVYIVGKASVAQTTDNDGSYYVYDAVVNGSITTVKVDATLAGTENLTSGSTKIYKSVNTNTAGIITSVGDGGLSATGTKKDVNGTIGLGSNYYMYTNDCVVFYVDTKGNISASSIGAIATDATDTVKYITNSNGRVTTIVVEEQVSDAKAVTAVSVTVDGATATLAGGNNTTAGTINGSKPAAGAVVTIVPTVSGGATAAVVVNGTTSANYTVASSDTYSTTVTFVISIVAEDGSTTTANYTLTLGNS